MRKSWCEAHIRSRGSTFRWRFAVGLLLLLSLSVCGKREQITTYPASAPAILRKPFPEVLPKVRILLAEGFASVEIKGSHRGETVRIRVMPDGLQLWDETSGTEVLMEEGSGFRLEASPQRFLEFEENSYRGVLEVFINPLGEPVVVNEVEIEDYLRSVLPRELGPRKFPQLEAQKAQAVAARTFAMKHVGTYARFGFDLYGDQRSQLYGGISFEDPLSDRGIDETRGIVAVFRGELILALYSSTCGGMTEAFHNVFEGDPIEYLRGGVVCHDQASPYHSWVERIDIQRIADTVNRYVQVGRLRKIVPLRKSQAGRVVEMLFEGDEGRKILRGNNIRFALGLRSSLLKALNPRYDASGHVQELVVHGKGWGHGVGMCQIGAVDLAQRGYSCERILGYYYPGIELVSLSGQNRPALDHE